MMRGESPLWALNGRSLIPDELLQHGRSCPCAIGLGVLKRTFHFDYPQQELPSWIGGQATVP